MQSIATAVVFATATALASAGCFYTAEIDARPSVAIEQLSQGPFLRGSTIPLVADVVASSNGGDVSVTWNAYACTVAAGADRDCDSEPFASAFTDQVELLVPSFRADGTTPVQAVRITLDAIDSLGATAEPPQELPLAISDEPPVLVLRNSSTHDYVIGSHIDLFADVSDPDDGPDAVTLAWQVFAPAQDNFALADAPPGAAADGHRSEAKTLVADGTGGWDVRVTATDPVGGSASADFSLTVTADEPPCAEDLTPLIASDPPLPMSAPTRFEVPVVVDDLDVYPASTGDPDAGVATFTWSLQVNGGARTPLAIAGNGVELDPSDYTPGDVLELRVEVNDRVDRSASFAACGDAASCTFNPVDPTCAQRETWRVEVQ